MIRALQAFCVLLSFVLAGATAVRADQPVQGFVKREGARLALDGQSFYFAGTNQYYLFYKSRRMIDEVLEDAAAMGLTVLRTWAFCNGEWHDGYCFQPKARVYDEATFQNLDYTIQKAGQLGIRLILTLANNWDAFGGMNTYVQWSGTARSHDDFYSDAESKALYRDYVQYVLNRVNRLTGVRYKDDPAILMWELANEPRIERSRAQELYQWLNEMAGFIKSIDPHHLVSSGSEGDVASDFVATHASPFIDIASFHLYPEDWNFSEAKTLSYIRRQVQDARQRLGKPIFCGELGHRDQKSRDATYASWYDEFNRLDVDGANFWLLSGHQDDGSLYPDYDGFTVYYPESRATVAVIGDFAEKLQAKSARALDLSAPSLTVTPPDAKLSGVVRLSGTAADDRQLSLVALNFGGGFRPVSGLESWSYEWDTRRVLDGIYTVIARATDAEGNATDSRVTVEVRNGSAKSGDWLLRGAKTQDDGYNFIYDLAASNQTGTVQEGHFVFRYFLTLDGALAVGSHYESSAVYRGDPKVSAPVLDFDGLSHLDIDMGQRRVEPGSYIGYKGQLSQADGAFKSYNDWSSGDIPVQLGLVQRVLLLKDGRPIAGFQP